MQNRRRDPIKSVQRRIQVEASLANYPELSPDKLLDLIYWFKREATPREVAVVAGNPDIQAKYRHFRERHLDQIRTGELAWGLGLGLLLVVMIAAVTAMP